MIRSVAGVDVDVFLLEPHTCALQWQISLQIDEASERNEAVQVPAGVGLKDLRLRIAYGEGEHCVEQVRVLEGLRGCLEVALGPAREPHTFQVGFVQGERFTAFGPVRVLTPERSAPLLVEDGDA